MLSVVNQIYGGKEFTRMSSSLIRTALLFMAVSLTLLVTLVDVSKAEDNFGKISGKVVDEETGEALIGATVMVEGTSLGGITDMDGIYRINNIPVGTYSLKVSSVGYTTTSVTSLVVAAKETTVMNLALSPQITEVEGITVTAKEIRNTQASMLKERKNAVAVQDAISSEEISRSGSGNAADAMTKVTGASVVGGKYVYVRGLGDRYSNTHLNGSALPSPDPDKPAVPMDLVPASLLDNIVVEKTFTPDKAGNFAGGSVNLRTKEFPETRTLTFSTSTGYNDMSTFEDVLTHDPSSKDWAGYDSGKREIPGIILQNEDLQDQVPEYSLLLTYRRDTMRAEYNPAGTPYSSRTEVAQHVYDSLSALASYMDESFRAFSTEMAPKKRQAPLNQSYALSYGDQWNFLGRPLGINSSITYSSKYNSYNDGFAGRYRGNPSSNALSTITGLNDIRTISEVLWGGLATLKYSVADNHKLGFSYMHNQSGESENRYLEGEAPEYMDPAEIMRTRVLHYTDRELDSYQYSGEHLLPLSLRANWQASFANTEQHEPDFRYYTDQASPELVEDPETGDLVPSGDTVYAIMTNRFPLPSQGWRDITEENEDYKFDLTLPLSRTSRFKAGTAYTKIDRTQRERMFDYYAAGGNNGNPADYASGIGLTRVDTTNSVIRWVFNNGILETTEDRNQVDGNQEIFALYGMLEIPLTSRLNMVGGVRYETTDMFAKTHSSSYKPGEIDAQDYLPSVNFIFRAQEEMNIRLSYGRTLARPTFKEISPAASQEFGVSRLYQGNPDLTYTLIDNYDVRWEWFIRPGEILAVSTFYKYFRNPIEQAIVGEHGYIVPENVDRAKVYGLELEFRRRLDHVTPFLRNFQLGGNLTLIESQVNIPDEEMFILRQYDENAADSRPLAGQSPYIVNLDFSYQNYGSGTTLSLYYNVFGRRLAFVAGQGTPDIYELPRNQVDFLASQRLFGGPSLKLSVKNILGTDAKFIHDDIGLPAQEAGEEFIYREYSIGTSYSIGISYQIW